MSFHTNEYIEEPFYHQVALLFQGRTTATRKSRHSCYEVICPRCHKRKAGMAPMNETYGFKCFRHSCGYKGNLHQVIQDYAPEDIKRKWTSARNKEDWNPIKNRRPRGPKKPPLTELEKLQIRGLKDSSWE